MTVREVINESAELLGLEPNKETIDLWVDCYNIIENELLLDYFPCRTVDKVLIKKDKIYYDDLKHNAWRILSVQDFRGGEVKFRLYPDHIKLSKNYDGHYFFVRYNYVPKEKTIDDDCTLIEFAKEILKYGVCSEYCLMQGNFEEAKIWDSKYKHLIEIAYITGGRKK